MEAPTSKAVFLSYASQDSDAARRIAQALREVGVEVCFDESELRGGESWDASIQRQIAECALFVAIISAHTQARREGYFRLEWRLADERMRLMAEGTPFVLPVIVDATKERDALVPKSFLGVQWTWLPHGEVPPAFVARVQKLLGRRAAMPAALRSEARSETILPPVPEASPLVARVEPKEDSESDKPAPATCRHRQFPRTALIFAAGVLAGVALIALFVVSTDAGFELLAGRSSRLFKNPGVAKFTITLAAGQAVLSSPAISRDGRLVAFTAGTPGEEPRLYLRRLDELDSHIVPGTGGASAPFFSPNGRSIGFFANGRLHRWSTDGGAPVPLADAPDPSGGTWGDDNMIVFVPVWNGGVLRVPASGGTAEVLLRPDGKQDYAFVFPRFVPGRPEILFTAWGKNAGVWSLDLRTNKRSKVLPKADSGMVTTSGHLLVGMADSSSGLRPGMLATPYATRALSFPTPTLVQRAIFYSLSSPDFWSCVSDSGTLAYVPADVRAMSLVLVDRTGKVEVLSDRVGAFRRVSASRTTRRISVQADYKVWLYSLDDASGERLAPENRDADEGLAVWTPDGKSVVYASNQSGNWNIYARIPGALKSEVLLDAELDQFPRAMSREGILAFYESHPATGRDIWLLDRDGKSAPWLVTPNNEVPGQFSPDGRWLAYHSDESGRYEVYVKPVVGEAGRVQISTAGSYSSAWSPSSNVLFYQEAGSMWAVEVGSGEVPVLGVRQKLFQGEWALNPLGSFDSWNFDVLPDERFIMIRREPKAIPDRINVVVNWFDELRRQVPIR